MLDGVKLFDTEEIKDMTQTEIVLDFLKHSIKNPNCEFKVMKKHISEEEVATVPSMKSVE
jgi:hypothetical protein